MQRLGKYASTTIELVLETVLCNPLLEATATDGLKQWKGGVFYVVLAEKLFWK
jgi:hypothetical protein